MASKMLFESKNPRMLKSIIGTELAAEFTQFCMKKIITVSDIVNDNYKQSDLKMDIAKQYVTAASLACNVSDENINKVRNFVSNLGEEILATFDEMVNSRNRLMQKTENNKTEKFER